MKLQTIGLPTLWPSLKSDWIIQSSSEQPVRPQAIIQQSGILYSLSHTALLLQPNKLKPVQTVEERKEILKAIKYVDDIVVYQDEDTFLWYLKSGDYDVRFLGDDYNDGSYTGKDIDISIVFVDRSHQYSTTKLKNKICKYLK